MCQSAIYSSGVALLHITYLPKERTWSMTSMGVTRVRDFVD